MPLLSWTIDAPDGAHHLTFEHVWVTGAMTLELDGATIFSREGGLGASMVPAVHHSFLVGGKEAVFRASNLGRFTSYHLTWGGQKLKPAARSDRADLPMKLLLFGGAVLVGVALWFLLGSPRR